MKGVGKGGNKEEEETDGRTAEEKYVMMRKIWRTAK